MQRIHPQKVKNGKNWPSKGKKMQKIHPCRVKNAKNSPSTGENCKKNTLKE